MINCWFYNGKTTVLKFLHVLLRLCFAPWNRTYTWGRTKNTAKNASFRKRLKFLLFGKTLRMSPRLASFGFPRCEFCVTQAAGVCRTKCMHISMRMHMHIHMHMHMHMHIICICLQNILLYRRDWYDSITNVCMFSFLSSLRHKSSCHRSVHSYFSRRRNCPIVDKPAADADKKEADDKKPAEEKK